MLCHLVFSFPAEVVMFWNLENMFIPWGAADTLVADFRYGGSRGWNMERYLRKCNAVAKTVIALEEFLGKSVDFAAFAEIENRQVLSTLVRDTPLRHYHYGVIHFDSPDPRGIDVALLYDTLKYRCLRAFSRNVFLDSQPLQTRSILFACFIRKEDGKKVNISVNHHPSKYSGAQATAMARAAAMSTLVAAADSMYCADSCLTVLTGDFNEIPLSDTLPGSVAFVNLAYSLHKKGRGTIKFGGKWEMIDHFYIPVEYSTMYEMEIFQADFLLEQDRKYLGVKPRRTYIGPRYNFGVSDHLPVVLMPVSEEMHP